MGPVPIKSLDSYSKANLSDALRASGLTYQKLISPKRVRSISHKRWLAFKSLYDAGHSMEDIGLILGKDHSSVSHGLKRLKNGI